MCLRHYIPKLAALLLAVGILLDVGSAQTVSNVYSFTGKNQSQAPGYVTPTQGRDGKLYGTTTGPPPVPLGSTFVHEEEI